MAKTILQRADEIRRDEMHERLADELIDKWRWAGKRGEIMTFQARALKDLIRRRQQQGQGNG